jgi:hypothetical protein
MILPICHRAAPLLQPAPPSFYLNRFTLSLRAPHYEIVVFTAGVAEYAAPLVDCIDPSGLVSHRLYRHHTTVPPPALRNHDESFQPG